METIEVKTIRSPVTGNWAVEPWLNEIEQHSNGRVKFVYHSDSGEMGGDLVKKGTDLLNIILNGEIDLGDFMTSYFSDSMPLSGVFGMPFLYPSTDVAATVGWQLLKKYMLDTDYKEVKPLWLSVPGILKFHFVCRPVYKLEDLKYMKFNVHGVLPASAFQALGGDSIEAEATEFADFLRRRLLDGVLTNWVNPRLNVNDFTKYSIGNLNPWTTGMPWVMNLEKWNSLPPDIQQIFLDTSGLQKSQQVGATFDRRDRESLEKIKKEGLREIYDLPEEEKARWVEAVQPAIDEWIDNMESKGLPGRAIIKDARELVRKYSKGYE